MASPVYDALTRATLLGASDDVRGISGDRYDHLTKGARKIIECAFELAQSKGVDDPIEAVRLAVTVTAKRGDDAATMLVMAAGHDWLQGRS